MAGLMAMVLVSVREFTAGGGAYKLYTVMAYKSHPQTHWLISPSKMKFWARGAWQGR